MTAKARGGQNIDGEQGKKKSKPDDLDACRTVMGCSRHLAGIQHCSVHLEGTAATE